MAIARFTTTDPALQRWVDSITTTVNSLEGETRSPNAAVRKSELSSIESEIATLKRGASTPAAVKAKGGQKSYTVSGTDGFSVPPTHEAVVIKTDTGPQVLTLPDPQPGLMITFCYAGGTVDIMSITAGAAHTIWDSDNVTVTPAAGKTLRVSSVRGIVTVVGLSSSAWAAHTEAGTTTYV